MFSSNVFFSMIYLFWIVPYSLVPLGEWLPPAVSRRYVRRAVGIRAQSARNDEETDAHLRVGLLKSYVRQGRTVLGIKPPHYLRDKEQGWTGRRDRCSCALNEYTFRLKAIVILLPDEVLPEEASEFPLLEVEVRRGSGPCTLAVTLGSASHSVEVAVHYVS